MKKCIFLFSTLLIVVSVSSQTSFCDDFDSYQNGDPIAETSPDWNTWGELMSGTSAPFVDDANVSNILSNSGSNSLYLLVVNLF